MLNTVLETEINHEKRVLKWDHPVHWLMGKDSSLSLSHAHIPHPEMTRLLGEHKGIGKEDLTTAKGTVFVTKHTIPGEDGTTTATA